MVYNLGQTVFNCWLFYSVFWLWRDHYSWTCQPVDYSNRFNLLSPPLTSNFISLTPSQSGWPGCSGRDLVVFYLEIFRFFRLFLLRAEKEILPPLQSPRHSPRWASHSGVVRSQGKIKVCWLADINFISNISTKFTQYKVLFHF